MANQESHGIWYEITGKLFNRGLFDDILNTPGNIISQVLSSPATTTQNNDQAVNTPVAATTQAAAAPAATTQAAAAPVATTHAPAAQQPAATPASSPKQEEQKQTPTSAAQAPATTQQPIATNAAATIVTATGSSPAAVLTTSAPAAAETVPPAAENAASSPVLSQTANSIATGAVNSGGAATTKPGATSSTQTPHPPGSGSTSNSNNQGPLVATGVVLGIVVLLGFSLLVFWCYRRKKRAAALRGHEVVPPESPINEYDSNDRFRDHVGQAFHGIAENRAINVPDELIIQHPQPGQPALTQTHPHAQPEEIPRANPYAAQPFSYAQAQQYVQSLADTGTFGFPPPPPIPEPSPIRIFRWPTRSSRTGSSTTSVFSGLRSNKSPSRHQSRASRSTMSSMLWHGRRDIIARSTMKQSSVSPRSNFFSTPTPESTMPEGLHTPVLDWLNWIRGHQQVEPDPEMNHRKSFASTTESSTSEGSGTSSASTASSGVFSPTLLSWHAPANTPCVTPETFQYIPLPLFRSPSSNTEKMSETSGGVRVPNFG